MGYQNMSPPDGNWLGKDHNASVDTDWVQFKNFGFWTVDFSFLQRQYFNDVFGIHYGAGLGLAIIQGDILRTSSSSACTDSNTSNAKACRPVVCTSPNGGCTEAELKSTESGQLGTDSPTNPRRFREGSVPGAIPILNLIFGLDFRIPQAPGSASTPASSTPSFSEAASDTSSPSVSFAQLPAAPAIPFASSRAAGRAATRRR